MPKLKEINCRLCNVHTKNGIEIFGKEGVKLSIGNILAKHFSIQMIESDSNWSPIICKKCWRITDRFHNLYLIVQHSESTYHLNLDEKTGSSIDNFDIKIDSGMIESVSRFESLFAAMSNDSNIENCEDEDMLVSVEPKVVKSKKRVTAKRKVKADLNKITIKKNIVTKEEKMNQQNRINNELEMICDICKVIVSSFTELKTHLRLNHNVPGYVRCCGQKFFRRGKLYAHILDHNNFGQYRCDKCDKIFIDKDHFTAHIYRHDPASRKYQCNECPKRFTTTSILNDHLFSVHKTSEGIRSFICDICGKTFVTKKVLASHMISMHIKKYVFVCDICARKYPSRTALNYHCQTVHLKIKLPKVQCKLCGIWLAHLVSLKRHMKLHAEGEETCKLCGKIAPNSHALKGHIRSVHNTQVFNCSICGKTFKSNKALQEHINSHTGSYLYKCTFCPMEFNSNANMYKHRKKMHPIQWQAERDRKYNDPATDQNIQFV